MNFGPQHPAAHGVLRLILELDGECVVKADPHVGLLHRGTEKLLEHRSYFQGLPYFDRLDYVSMMAYEHLYSLGVEQLLDLEITLEDSKIRTLFLELTRLLNHLMAVTTHALDVGALTPFLWAFEEREKMMEFYERVSGARMHTSYIRPGGVANSLDPTLLADLKDFTLSFPFRLQEIEEMLSGNRIWRQRLVDVGCVSYLKSLDLSFSGPMLRGSGFGWDLRLINGYEMYPTLDFSIPVGLNGDCYDRYLVRIEEMRQSCYIMYQLINEFEPPTESSLLDGANFQMERLIQDFKFYAGGSDFSVLNQVYLSVEAPKGELGLYLQGGLEGPTRCHVRPPGFIHLSSLNEMSSDHMIADVVTIIGTQDIVFGEIDR